MKLVQRASGLVVPEPTPSASAYSRMAGRDRNKPCPCNSGRKWKRCHGRGR